MTDTVVIGVGSPLMGDDGVGLVALERLRGGWTFDPHVELLDGGTWGMNLLPFVEAASKLVFLDALRAGRPEGAVVRLERHELPRFLATKLSPHQIDLKEVLALAELRGTLPERTVVLGVEPGRVELHDGLSEPVAGAVDALVRQAVDLLRGWGHVPRPRSILAPSLPTRRAPASLPTRAAASSLPPPPA